MKYWGLLKINVVDVALVIHVAVINVNEVVADLRGRIDFIRSMEVAVGLAYPLWEDNQHYTTVMASDVIECRVYVITSGVKRDLDFAANHELLLKHECQHKQDYSQSYFPIFVN